MTEKNHIPDVAQPTPDKDQLFEQIFKVAQSWDHARGFEGHPDGLRGMCIDLLEKVLMPLLAAQPPAAAVETDSEVEIVCAEAYQVVGSMLSDLGQFDTEHGQKILDNLSQARMVHSDILPWPSFEPADKISFFAGLTPEQQKAALAYRGPENHGDPAYARSSAANVDAPELLAIADRYEDGLKKMIASGYEEFGPEVQRQHRLIIDALRHSAGATNALTSTEPQPAPVRGPDCACCEQQPRKDCAVPGCSMKGAEWALPARHAGSLQCLRCGTVDAFGPASKREAK